MKTQVKTLGMIVAVVGLVVGAFATAHAAPPTTPPWYEVSVDQAGIAQGNPNAVTIVILTDTAAAPAFTARWFKVDKQIANQVLATALTSQATGKHARVYLADTAAGKPVTRFYLIQ